MSYCTLEAAKRYLKSIDALADDPAKGVTQDDLTQAQTDAQALVDSALAPYFDVSGWAEGTPVIIEAAAELLASAQVLRYRYQRDSLGGSDAGRFADVLRAEGEALLGELGAGRLHVVLADGSIQRMRPGVGSTVPRGSNPED